jgi:predicted component of type VI protein secretion system
MALSIKILKKVGARSDMIASRSWPQSRITIGRGEECTLVLEDPNKHVSRVHVELEEKGEGGYHLTVIPRSTRCSSTASATRPARSST